MKILKTISFGEALAPIINQYRDKLTDIERDLNILFPIRLKNAFIYEDRITIFYGPQSDTVMFHQIIMYDTMEVEVHDDELTFQLRQKRS